MFRWFTILIISLIAAPVSGQEYKYKELVALLDGASPQEQISMLWNHLTYDPNQPNADFRLAKLHYDLFMQADPLIEYQTAMAHAHEASERFFRASIIVTESEVRRNNEFYAPFFNTVDSKGRPYVEFPAVQRMMRDAYDSAMKFSANMPLIYRAFTKSVNQYGNAVKIFSALNNRYKTLEDMLLLFDGNIDRELKSLKMAYDSSIIYFDQYIALRRDYPVKNYNQQYVVKPITVYHLDGLTTGLNFLVPRVDLWNYGAWVDSFYKMYNEEIVPLRAKLEQNETTITSNLDQIQMSTNEPPEFHDVDKDLAFNLNKFDKNSVALAVIKYKAFKQKWMARENAIVNDTTNARKLDSYSVLIHYNRRADSLHTSLRQLINPLAVQKHRDFFSKFYRGEQGLSEFAEQEGRLISGTFAIYRDTLKASLLTSLKHDEQEGSSIKLGGYSIPLFVRETFEETPGAIPPVTLKKTRNPDGSMYLGGIHRSNRRVANIMAFVARVNPDGKTGWVKEYNLPPDSLSVSFVNRVADIVATQEGCAAIITSSDSSHVANTFVFINEQGKETIHPIGEKKIARRILYQERSNSFVMTFKGDGQYQDYLKDETLSLVSINILGDLLWRRDVPLSGTIEDIVAVRDGYVVVGNYTTIKNSSGKEFKTRAGTGQASPYLIKFGLDGSVLNIAPITTTRSICIRSVVKVNDESINLLGVDSPFTDLSDTIELDNSAVHMMADYNLKRICSDF